MDNNANDVISPISDDRSGLKHSADRREDAEGNISPISDDRSGLKPVPKSFVLERVISPISDDRSGLKQIQAVQKRASFAFLRSAMIGVD